MDSHIRIHVTISGKVQGVWFRASAKEQADRLGLTGWVRNLSDGRVEVMAVGSQDDINAFREWLKQGPTLAQVTHFEFEELPWEEYNNFEVR